MKLSKLPLLVQEEVLHNMSYTNLFLLSFLSRKVKKLIKSSQMNRSKMIDYIEYECDSQQEPFVQVFYKHDLYEELMVIAKNKDTHNEYIQLNVSGKMIDIQISDEYIKPIVRFQIDENEAVISSMHNSFLEFFGNSVEFRWKACGYNNCIPHLQNLKGCIKFSSHGANKETLENFFSSAPAFKWIDVSADGKTEPSDPESKFYQAESIQTLQLRNNSPDILSHFQGKQVVFKFGHCNFLDVISFVNRWKSGEAYHKLEYLMIEVFWDVFPQNEILNAIGPKHLDEMKKPPTHCVPKIYIDYFWSKPNTDPITSHVYVVRETNNHVASVSIQERFIHFGVWNKTEDEFLKIESKNNQQLDGRITGRETEKLTRQRHVSTTPFSSLHSTQKYDLR
ncbi:hypothetical protein B9Z55_010988 [Caenorhabditis nigoni]|uniref:F-box domain-containing protein n=1 Tax=Caenorhabditis nigoni TaxID=1611254 RepID=A0A2G5UI60_9PELO|nr:hypothetical protein B9Z55_010988 [Caenorhabditis nigoni]